MQSRLTCQAIRRGIYAFSTCAVLGLGVSNCCHADELDAPINSDKVDHKAEALFKKGHDALDHKHLEVAEKCYRKAIELEPTQGKFHRQLSLLLLRERRLPEAERECRIDTTDNPDDWRGFVLLGRILHMQRRFDEECAIYKKAIAVLPSDQKQLKTDMQNFIDTDTAAVKKEADVKRLRKELEEEQYKDLY
jgi:tetratricopeptide (TPR) repeat protein